MLNVLIEVSLFNVIPAFLMQFKVQLFRSAIVIYFVETSLSFDHSLPTHNTAVLTGFQGVWRGSLTSTLSGLSPIHWHSLCYRCVHFLLRSIGSNLYGEGLVNQVILDFLLGIENCPHFLITDLWSPSPVLLHPPSPYFVDPPPLTLIALSCTFSPSFWNHWQDINHPWYNAICLDVSEHSKITISFFREVQTFEEAFSYACPKFISPVPPNFDAPPANFNRVNELLFVRTQNSKLISFTDIL